MTTTTAQDFRRVLAAQSVSNFGSMLSRLAIPWLAAVTLNATPWQMSGMLLADVAAGALGAPLLGAWVDRWPKRGVMLACDMARTAVLLGLALAAWTQSLSVVALTIAAAACGVLNMAFELARSAWMAQALKANELTARNAQLSVAGSLSETAAFALGGWLFQGLGAVWALLLDALSYVLSALCLRGVRDVPAAPQQGLQNVAASALTSAPTSTPPSAPTSSFTRLGIDIRTSMAVIWASPVLRRLALLELLLALSSAQFATSYLVYLSRDIHVTLGVQGMIFAMGGLGAIVGGWLAVHWGQRMGEQRALAWGLVVATVGGGCIPLATDAGALALALLVAHQVVGDAGMTVAQTHDRTLRQTQVAQHQLALVDGALRAIGQGATLLGALLAGALATAQGNRSALMLAVALLAAAALCAGLSGSVQSPKRLSPKRQATRHNRAP